jgi:hypothetical protein
MPCIDEKEEIKHLIEDPTSFAMMMDEEDLQDVIAAFVSVLNQRTKDRGG